jgi:hypothetical protein
VRTRARAYSAADVVTSYPAVRKGKIKEVALAKDYEARRIRCTVAWASCRASDLGGRARSEGDGRVNQLKEGTAGALSHYTLFSVTR